MTCSRASADTKYSGTLDGMRDRFVFVPHESGQRVEELVGADDDLVCVRADGLGHFARPRQLAERALLERDGKGLQRPVDHAAP